MSIEQKIALVRTPAEWGGEVETAAFSAAMRTKITIFRDGHVYRVYQPESFSRAFEVLFLNENHYDMVVEEGIPVAGECVQINVPEEPSPELQESQSSPQESQSSQKEEEDDDQLITQTDEVLNSDEMKDDCINERTLTSLLQNEFLSRESTIAWLTANGVFPSTMNCPNPSCGGGKMIRRPFRRICCL